jgi:hypothetical protein
MEKSRSAMERIGHKYAVVDRTKQEVKKELFRSTTCEQRRDRLVVECYAVFDRSFEMSLSGSLLLLLFPGQQNA